MFPFLKNPNFQSFSRAIEDYFKVTSIRTPYVNTRESWTDGNQPNAFLMGGDLNAQKPISYI